MTAERRVPSLHRGDRVVVHVDGVATTTVATVQFTKANQWGLVNAYIVGENFATWVLPAWVATDPRFDPTSSYQVHPADDSVTPVTDMAFGDEVSHDEAEDEYDDYADGCDAWTRWADAEQSDD